MRAKATEPLSREAAADRSPGVERSGTLGPKPLDVRSPARGAGNSRGLPPLPAPVAKPPLPRWAALRHSRPAHRFVGLRDAVAAFQTREK